MKLPRSSLLVIALVLVVSGLGHSVYRHVMHDVAWFPGDTDRIWDVEAMVSLEARGEPVTVRLTVPDDPPGFVRMGEHTASPGYGLSFVQDRQRRAEWTVREAEGTQVLYYRAQFTAVEPDYMATEPLPEPSIVTWPASLQVAAADLLERAYRESADGLSLADAIDRRLQDGNNQNAQLLLSEMAPHDALVRLLHQADVAARIVQGLVLEDGRRRQSLRSVVQVFGDGEWRLFDPAAGGRADPASLLLWEQTGGPVLEVTGGDSSGVSFSMMETLQPAAATGGGQVLSEAVFNLSIYSLPISEQAIFRSILLLPLGALVVVLFRAVVGLETAGTFMPVLIALAFLKMSLLPGLITFLLVIAGGLVLRQAMAHLNLLLVARVSVVIVCVIGLIALLSVVSFHLGFAEALSMPFFPMIILAWTIERLSILWEEEGPREVFHQGTGSLVTAVAAYMVMQGAWVQYWMFNFLGLQLVVLALIMMLGSYTGYRLSELWRFRPFLQRDHA